jgi:hypothetical protein
MDQPQAFDQLQRHLTAQAGKPTFDEWYAKRNGGRTFEQDHMESSQRIEQTMRALTRLMRDYVSEMVR